MAKNNPSQRGSQPSWGKLGGAAVQKLLTSFGGYTPVTPGRDQGGTWLAMGEPGGIGATPQQNGIMWGSVGISVATGTTLHSIMIESPRQVLANNAAPLFQRLTLAVLDGQIDIGPVYSAVTLGAGFVNFGNIGVGMYMSDFNPTTALYNIQDPSNPADVSRFDWIYLEERALQFTLGTGGQYGYANANFAPKAFDLTKTDFNQVLGPGQALMLSLAFNSTVMNVGGGSMAFFPNLRAYLTRGS